MLVLSRKTSQRIRIGDSVVITVVRVSGNTVRLGIEAPGHVSVLREELLSRPSQIPTEPPGGGVSLSAHSPEPGYFLASNF